MTIDTDRKQSQRAAYLAYVRLYWIWTRLAPGDPAYTPLAEATRRAEARWRALMRPADDIVLTVACVGDASRSAAPTAAGPTKLDTLVSTYSIISLSAWGH